MNSTDIFILLFVFFIIKIFFDILIPDKKKKRNYRKKTTKMTENQKFIILGIILSIILFINFPRTAFFFIIILTTIGVYLFLKHNNILDMFKKESTLEETLKKYDENEKQRKKYNEEPNPYLNTRKRTTAHSREAKKRAGDNYEKEVGKYYESFGYKLVYNGLEKGYLDEGIDLIATKKDKTLLIQCKNWKNSLVTMKEIHKFLDNCNQFTSKRNFETPIIEKIFVVSNKKKNIEIEEFIQRNKNLFEYKEIPFSNIYN